MVKNNLTPSSIIGKLLADNPNLKLEEAQPKDLGMDSIADGYFSPDLNVSINLKNTKILKIHDGENSKAFWIRDFLPISRGMVVRNHKGVAIADLILVRLSHDRVFLKGTLNEKPLMAYFEVEPTEWFIDAMLHAAGMYLRDYGERSLIVFRDE